MGMALAVGISVMASYFLSRTIIPTLVMYLLRDEAEHHGEPSTSVFGRINAAFNRGFDSFRHGYVSLLDWALHHRKTVFGVFGVAVISTVVLLPFVGRDFFPAVDAGQIRMHVIAPAGTRIEQTEKDFTAVASAVREMIPDQERSQITDVIGVPDGINLAVTDSNIISPADGEMLISLKDDHKVGTADYVKKLRTELASRFPRLQFYFESADIVSQILNFGVPSPIDIQVTGVNRTATYAAAQSIRDQMRLVPGAVDVRIHQILNAPQLHIEVDPQRTIEAGLTQRDVANNVLVATATSFAVTPNYWVDPNTGLKYGVSVETPKRLIQDVQDLQNLNLPTRSGDGQLLLSDAAKIDRRVTPVVANHENIQPTFNVRAAVQGTDLGSVGKQIDRIVNDARAKLPPGATITLRGQSQSMNSAFGSLALGILFAAVLVYLLMVVNFQSWTDPFIIITALGGALVGIVWMLYLTHTTFSVPSLMGAIMAVGVATANSILMVTFANSRRHEAGDDAMHAALAAGYTRLRPVLMTALAMILGMLPMSLGLGEGGEQNAPLGRAVIGGLLVATVTTLFFVPVVYTLLRRKAPRPLHDSELDDVPSPAPARAATNLRGLVFSQ
jgi:multidrug efflux pump subunit AcrB